MKFDAVEVTSTNIPKTIQFYSLLGFSFPEYTGQQHVDAVTEAGGVRFMIDDATMMQGILGYAPKPGNHASIAINCGTPDQVDATVAAVKEAGFAIAKEPWDAFWGQRYAVVEDPDGYLVDLYASR
ncbi:MAG TPA: VOC family protein [Candidatus Paceibacterota bacterium]|nr:VOC family protein [Candidatus Paceibacterota bacterium]